MSRQIVIPTTAEFRLLEILWVFEEGTIEDLLLASEKKSSLNYKTVQTVLRIMENKKLVSHSTRGRAFVYRPRVKRHEVSRLSLRSLLGSHDRHGFDRLILGSVSESIALCRLLARDHPQVSYFATKSRGFPLPTSFPSVNHMIEKGQTKQPLMPVLPQRETLVFPVTAWRRRFNVHSKHRPLGL